MANKPSLGGRRLTALVVSVGAALWMAPPAAAIDPLPPLSVKQYQSAFVEAKDWATSYMEVWVDRTNSSVASPAWRLRAQGVVLPDQTCSTGMRSVSVSAPAVADFSNDGRQMTATATGRIAVSGCPYWNEEQWTVQVQMVAPDRKADSVSEKELYTHYEGRNSHTVTWKWEHTYPQHFFSPAGTFGYIIQRTSWLA